MPDNRPTGEEFKEPAADGQVHPFRPEIGGITVGPAPAKIIAAAQREQGDDDEGGPETEADTVKRTEDAGAEQFDGEHGRARHCDEEVDEESGRLPMLYRAAWHWMQIGWLAASE